MMDSNYFANLIASAPMQTSSRYFEAGIYLVEIDNCKILLKSSTPTSCKAVECTVIGFKQCRVPTNYTNLLGCVS